MNLPVTNKKDALLKAVVINFIVIIMVLIMTLNVNDFNFGHWFVLPFFIWGIFHYFRNNIKEAVLENGNICLSINNRTIKIPISEISSIEPAAGIHSFLAGTFRTTYFLYTKRKYSFGSTILLRFISEKVEPEEPIEIKTIKSIMAHKQK